MTTTELSETERKITEYFVDEVGDEEEVDYLTDCAHGDLFDLIELTEASSLFELYDSLGSSPDRTDKEDCIYSAAAALFRLKALSTDD